MTSIEPKELAQKILDQITMYPKSHEQCTWTGYNECGTTHCIAGWAAKLTEGLNHFPSLSFIAPNSYPSGDDLDQGDAFMRVGTKTLGLNHEDASRLFLYTNNDQAVMALKYLANGEKIDWKEVYSDNV